MFSVRSRALTGTVEPLGARVGTVATATTDALIVGSVELVVSQTNGVPGAGGATVNVCEYELGE